MKKLSLVLGTFFLAWAASTQAAEYGFDKAHTHIGFSVKHILGLVPGEFKEYDGTFSFDEKKPASSKVAVTIQADSINTNNEGRDHHLKTPEFFDVEKFPTLTFVSKKVAKTGGTDYSVEGDLTIHGVTKPVTLSVQYLGSDNMMGADIAGFSATTRIDRRDFGLTWSKVLASGNLMVGNEVNITLDVTGMDKAALEKMKNWKKAPKKKDEKD